MIFFCDIRGTFDECDDTRKKELSEFVDNLIKISKDKRMIFSFVSSDEIDYVKEKVDELKPYFEGTNIVFGYQFGGEQAILGDEIYNVGTFSKYDQMVGVLENEEYKEVFYAEDLFFNQKIFKEVVSKKFPDINLMQFIPGTIRDNMYGSEKKGIDGLNETLTKYIVEKENQIKL